MQIAVIYEAVYYTMLNYDLKFLKRRQKAYELHSVDSQWLTEQVNTSPQKVMAHDTSTMPST